LKTAVMLGACLKSGAIIGGASENDQKYLYEFGILLGIAFQIKDDWLDVYGNSDVFGKKTGGDILCNKKTFLLVKALEAAEDEDRNTLYYWLGNNMQQEEKVIAVRRLYDKLSVDETTKTALKSYYSQAISVLKKVSVENETKKELEKIVENLIDREY